MDRLIQYIDFRTKLYGCIDGKKTTSSNYYTIGNMVIRISDHLKYGTININRFDYCFIIQPDNKYIFTASPKLQKKDSKMYVKIVTYQEAKEFIRKLHDFAVRCAKMTDVYRPENWNKSNTIPKADKLEWSVFYDTYMKPQKEIIQLNILDQIERACRGTHSKGNLSVKLEKIPEIYNELTEIQLENIIEFIEEKEIENNG